MDVGGLGARILHGGTALVGLIMIILAFLTFTSFMSAGVEGGGRRSSTFLVVVVLVAGALAVSAALFPETARDLMARMSRDPFK